MGKGRPFAGHKITPPAGARWAPKPNARARCMRVKLLELGKGGDRVGQMKHFIEASSGCKIKGK